MVLYNTVIEITQKLFLGDISSIEFGAECEEHPRRESQPMDNGNG